jgi:hypothetical protein
MRTIGYVSDYCGEWRINTKLYLNNGLQGGKVKFLLDTGSEKTILAHADALRFGIDYSKLPCNDRGVLGADGTTYETRFIKNAGIAFFVDQDGISTYLVETLDKILYVDPEKWNRDGIIGRDILKRFEIDPRGDGDTICLTRKCVAPHYLEMPVE